MSGELDGVEIDPTPFDSWLDDRLLGKPDATWLAPHGAAASATFCRKFGEGMAGGTASDDPIQKRRWAVAKAFTVVGEGLDEVRTYLLDLARGADTVADPVKTAHGGTIFALESHLRDDPGFDIFRDVLRDAVLHIWPVAPQLRFWGCPRGNAGCTPCPQRRLSYSGPATKAMVIKYAGEARQIMRARQVREKRQ
ncbi:hypothetical protein [Haematobacter genomosp. 1]|uniref:Uncharacterized protein n=1 Tax=Haematobacter genomosp. 1 TaxID=366618 RepID=A0A212A9J7_9RHOB|nr:hypothetical protein [Haematobacter genomosp. 1]OWJ76407.1 hypothetical protein CDV49_15270 [Haematobacter genomosp. 1]